MSEGRTEGSQTTESSPPLGVDQQLKALRRKSFEGLLATTILKTLGLAIFYFAIGPPVPMYPLEESSVRLASSRPISIDRIERGLAPDSVTLDPTQQAYLNAVKAADERALTAFRTDMLIGGIVVVGFLGLAFWSRTAPLVPAAIALAIHVFILVWNLSVVGFNAVSIIGSGFALIIALFLIHSVRAGWKHRQLSTQNESRSVV